MFERYTEDARRALFFARYEATQLGVRSIETEHLLLGLLREAKGLTGRILATYDIDDLRREVEGRTERREIVPTSIEIPFSPETKNVLHFAVQEADRLQHREIGTAHLLLGLLREERSVAASILNDRGLRLASVRAQAANGGHSSGDEKNGEIDVSLAKAGTTARYRMFQRGTGSWQEVCAEATGFATNIGPEKVISVSVVPDSAMSGNAASGFVVVWYWE